MTNTTRSISDPTHSKEDIYVKRIERALSGELTWEKVNTATALFQEGESKGHFMPYILPSVSYASWEEKAKGSTRDKAQKMIGEAITALSTPHS